MNENPDEPWWWDYEIKGIMPFKGRRVGSLSREELKLLKEKWLPTVLEKYEYATPEQAADSKALLDCIRFRDKYAS